MNEACHPSRSRYAFFRLLAKFGLGCKLRRPAGTVWLARRPRHNPLEAWTIGISFYILYAAALARFAQLATGSGTRTTAVLFVVFLPVAFLCVFAMIGLASLGIDLFGGDAGRDERRRPDLQSGAQQAIMLVVCFGMIVMRGWSSWLAFVWLAAVAFNASIAIAEPVWLAKEEKSAERSW